MALQRAKGKVVDGSVNSIADLPATGFDGQVIDVASFYDVVPNIVPDGGGGRFVYDASANANLHDGGTIIDPTHTVAPGATGWWTAITGTGVWRRIYDGFLNIAWFGSPTSISTIITSPSTQYQWSRLETVSDSSLLSVDPPAGIQGYGILHAADTVNILGSNIAGAVFLFDSNPSDAEVILLSQTNVSNTLDTASKVNVYGSSNILKFQNKLGSSTKIAITLWYSSGVN